MSRASPSPPALARVEAERRVPHARVVVVGPDVALGHAADRGDELRVACQVLREGVVLLVHRLLVKVEGKRRERGNQYCWVCGGIDVTWDERN